MEEFLSLEVEKKIHSEAEKRNCVLWLEKRDGRLAENPVQNPEKNLGKDRLNR